MGTDELICAALAELLQVKPYDKIRIQDICAQAHLSRSTFSKRFCDKDDVVEAQMYADFVAPVKKLHSLLPSSYTVDLTRLMLERFFQSFADNRAYYEALAKNKGSMWVVEKIGRQMHGLNIEQWGSLNLDESEKSFICDLFAYAHPIILKWWMDEGFQTPALRVAELTDIWLHAHWREDVSKKNGYVFSRA